jgi:drug/metabolite transporter (DMT)-like permease
MSPDLKRLRAVQMLVLANACWALSFPTMKALEAYQSGLLENSNSWFISSSTLVVRFALAAVVMLLICARTLRRLTRLEIWEGLGLGLFGGVGLIFQMDGLAHTAASTSAFLTQFYCLLIPLIVAWQSRRWPSPTVAVSSLMVIAGVAVLSNVDWTNMHIGRGELETLIASTIFTGQILWLQRAKFAANNVNHFTLVMFVVTGLVCLPVALVTGSDATAFAKSYSSGPMWIFIGLLTIICTLGGYLLMNYWQPKLTATQAGLLYCLEPIFASLFAMFLPGWFSAMAGIRYLNEQIGWNLVIGGGLITAANALIQIQSSPPARLVDNEDRPR